MTTYQFRWLYEGEKVGWVKLRIIETRAEAEVYDHCWTGRSSIIDQLNVFKIKEEYPALLLRRIDINDDCRNKSHGTALLNFVEDFALRNQCSFCFCKLELNDDMDKELQSFYLNRGWNLLEETEQRIILTPDPDEAYIMGYFTPRKGFCSYINGYHAEEESVSESEKELERP